MFWKRRLEIFGEGRDILRKSRAEAREFRLTVKGISHPAKMKIFINMAGLYFLWFM